MFKPISQAALDRTFQQCLAAARDPVHHTVVAHLWSPQHKELNPNESAPSQWQEFNDVLKILAGDASISYGTGRPDFPFYSHKLRGTSDGYTGFACSMVSAKPEIFLADYCANTGLLLLDAPATFVAPYDAWTTYYQNSADIPGSEAWEFLRDFANKIHTKKADHPTAHGTDYFADHPEVRAKLAGRLGVLYLRQHDPFIDLVIKQGDPNDVQHGFIALDPHSKDVKARAKQAYAELANTERGPDSRETEVNVNAKLEHVAGVVVYMNRNDPPIDLSGGKSILDCIKENQLLAKRLSQAFKEYDKLTELFEQHGMQRDPTIIVYQPHAKEPLIHAPPTAVLRQEVKATLSKETLGNFHHDRGS